MTVSILNKTNKELKANEEFNGHADDVSKYVVIQLNIMSDQDGICRLLHGQDGINWDYVDEFKINANQAFLKDVPVKAQFMKVNYTNSKNDQSIFRLSCIYKENSLLLLNYLEKMQKLQKSVMRETVKCLQMANTQVYTDTINDVTTNDNILAD